MERVPGVELSSGAGSEKRRRWKIKENFFTMEGKILEDVGWRFWKGGKHWVVIPVFKAVQNETADLR